MTTVTTIGLDLAKKVFQVHGVEARWTSAARNWAHAKASPEPYWV